MRNRHSEVFGFLRDGITQPAEIVAGPRRLAIALFGLLALAALGCGELATEADPAPPGFDVPVSVNAVYPAEGGQGQTIEVRIVGEGFVDGAVPSWERDGIEDTMISVEQVVFVSDSVLLANVSIGLDADPTDYDVVVSRTRKRGIGSEVDKGAAGEIFKVTEFTNGYEIVVIGSLFPNAVSVTRAWGINDLGAVVGFTLPGWDYGSGPRAFGWNAYEGIYELLGTIGFEYGQFDASVATGINNAGSVIGMITKYTGDGGYTTIDPYTRQAFVKNAGSLMLLPSPVVSWPEAINDAGTVVGAGGGGTFGGDSDGSETRTLVWRRVADGSYENPVDLGPWHPGFVGDVVGQAPSSGINARGDVFTHGQRGRPLLWRSRPDGSYGAPVELGVPDGERAHAMAINDEGWIVGASGNATRPFSGDDLEALLWHPADYSKPIRLGAGVARAINNDNRVVGSNQVGGGDYSAVLWTVNEVGEATSTIRLRASSGYDASAAFDINADGWIVGYSWRMGDWIATLWRPADGG